MPFTFVKHFELPCVEMCYINKLALPCLMLEWSLLSDVFIALILIIIRSGLALHCTSLLKKCVVRTHFILTVTLYKHLKKILANSCKQIHCRE